MKSFAISIFAAAAILMLAAFLLRPTRIEDVFTRAREGRVLPQKTTYFFPKLTSGLLFQPLD